MTMDTRQLAAQVPVAYYDTVVTMFKGLGIYTREGRVILATIYDKPEHTNVT